MFALSSRTSAVSPLSIVSVFFGSIVILFISGCGTGAGDPYERFPIRGTVTLDGDPVVTGVITFYPEKQGPVVSGTMIQEGRFQIPASQGLPSGRYKVSITSEVIEPDEIDPDELMINPPEPKSLIPKEYNSETTLVSEVQKSPMNVFDFELTTKVTVHKPRQGDTTIVVGTP